MVNIKNKYILTECLRKAKGYLKGKNIEKAIDMADLGLVFVLMYKDNGIKENEEVEGYRLELWRERYWSFLECNNLLKA